MSKPVEIKFYFLFIINYILLRMVFIVLFLSFIDRFFLLRTTIFPKKFFPGACPIPVVLSPYWKSHGPQAGQILSYPMLAFFKKVPMASPFFKRFSGINNEYIYSGPATEFPVPPQALSPSVPGLRGAVLPSLAVPLLRSTLLQPLRLRAEQIIFQITQSRLPGFCFKQK